MTITGFSCYSMKRPKDRAYRRFHLIISFTPEVPKSEQITVPFFRRIYPHHHWRFLHHLHPRLKEKNYSCS
ncbi:hypothetical protein L1987_47007 [Smallanthus sonchifolius]|uniref:Uncharacterized protein n=1 Tax=Smallanthus sonchifolius TaxID=185202 RepID=A0ACB9G1F3_9ASTR|nr:hypothetical protein L1987_47007 [Smallanthus sonchifolius]